MRGTCIAVVLALAVAAAADALAAGDFNVPKGPCGSAPVAKPQRRTGGESFPPLPLPATPLRRTEKKRPPSPPVLVAKIQFGDVKEVDHDGKQIRYYDWNKDPGDVDNLLNIGNHALNIRYTKKQGPLEAFTPDPAQFPVYYYTGSDDFTLSDAEVARLRDFLRSGGTVWGDTCFGDPDFFKAFTREFSRVLPGHDWHRLGSDHPLFHCYYQIDEVSYTQPVPEAPGGKGRPVVYGLDLGDRTAVILGRYDMSCGWDGHIRKGAYSVEPNDARRLGVNMVVYALGVHELARYQSTAKVYYEEQQRARGDFVFAQAKIVGNWDTEPNAIANLLKLVAANTSAEVKFQRKAVDLVSDELQQYPFLYVTARENFVLSDAQVQALRRYLTSGGFLLASPSSGMREFDAAFRREMARVLPNHPLAPLPADHPVYSILNRIQQRQLRRLRGVPERDAAAAAAGGHRHRRHDGRHLQPLRPGRRLARLRQPLRPRHSHRGRREAGGEHRPVRDDALTRIQARQLDTEKGGLRRIGQRHRAGEGSQYAAVSCVFHPCSAVAVPP